MAVQCFSPRADRVSDHADSPQSYSHRMCRPTLQARWRVQHRGMKMKRIVIATGGVLLLTAVAVAVLDWQGWPGLAPRIAERAGHGLQVDGDTRVHLIWKPRLASPQLRVLAADGQPLADAREVQLAWRWGDIWAWHRGGEALRLRRVQAESLALDWQRDAQGRTPWPVQPGGANRGQPTPLPKIDELVIRNGSARLDDAPLQLKADARFSTQADGRWEAGMQGQLRGQQLQLAAEADRLVDLISRFELGEVHQGTAIRRAA